MTATESHPAALRTAEPPFVRLASDDSEIHVLRLALELQLDAMLLTLGAAARSARYDDIPWQRWLVEDLEAARALAVTILAADGAPSPALGRGQAGAYPDQAISDLVARYESMQDLVAEVMQRPIAGQPWRPTARTAQQRCRDRLLELHEARAGLMTVSIDDSHSYLPGELLG
jgi:hypothetical protein